MQDGYSHCLVPRRTTALRLIEQPRLAVIFPGECRFLDGRIDDQAGDGSLSHLAVSVSNDLTKNRDFEKVAIGIVLELDIRVGFQCSYDPTAQTSVRQDLRCV